MNGRLLAVGIDIRLIGKQRTGDEVVFFQLVRELVRRQDSDIRYELFTDEQSADRLAALRSRLEALGRGDIEIISLSARNRFVWNGWVLPWRLFRHPIDVFHTQYILPLVLPRRLKVVTHIHDVSFRAHPEWIGAVDRLFLSLLIPRTLARSDRLIAPSVFTRDEICARFGFPPERVVVIANAAADEWYQSIPVAAIEAVLAKYGLARGRYFISSGTLQPRKNIPFLIAAFTRAVREHGLGHRLVLTGNPAGHNVDTQVRAVGDDRIIYTGYVSDADLRALVAGAAAYVFPSLYEGFGIPIEEALAQGTAVLASDIPAFREIGRERIHYFDPRALAPLADSLYTFSIRNVSATERRDERSTFGTPLYSWTESAAALVRLYRSLADRPANL
ncbi:MAG: glycosyltransferase family 4 protein [Candidatus Moraniibacteriota bacterium]|nr:MAG: glycosyltransferase family 4 protein [Candidatus Moranbacteria bacterium]